MTLINCIECDNQISDKALTCPHCGIPRSKIVTNVHNSVEFVDSGLKQSRRLFSTKFWFSTIGRISRSQYIIGIILLLSVFFSYNFLIDSFSDYILRNCDFYDYQRCLKKVIDINIILKLPIVFIVFYIFIALSIKRFHDLCKNGYQVLFLAIPIVGFYYLWILLSEKGSNHTNMYGEP